MGHFSIIKHSNFSLVSPVFHLLIPAFHLTFQQSFSFFSNLATWDTQSRKISSFNKADLWHLHMKVVFLHFRLFLDFSDFSVWFFPTFQTLNIFSWKLSIILWLWRCLYLLLGFNLNNDIFLLNNFFFLSPLILISLQHFFFGVLNHYFLNILVADRHLKHCFLDNGRSLNLGDGSIMS